jgi:hypothetical protein
VAGMSILEVGRQGREDHSEKMTLRPKSEDGPHSSRSHYWVESKEGWRYGLTM